MLTFNPGPSQLTDDVIDAIRDIAVSGFLSISHRSSKFKEVCRSAVEGLRDVFSLPPEYTILLQPSATAAMEMVLRNCVSTRSFHFVHGAFSQRFYETAREMRIEAFGFQSDPDQPVNWGQVDVPRDVDTICVTHNETSTGLMWPAQEIDALRARYPEPLMVIDATSSWGGVDFDWKTGDVWFASVQKCLGLPSGLAVVALSPRAMDVAGSTSPGVPWSPVAWQNVISMAEKMRDWQTPETPNMLGIALLARQMEHWDHKQVVKRTQEKARLIYRPRSFWEPFVTDPDWRSVTVAHFLSDQVDELKRKAVEQGMVLGSGYGPYKKRGLRIANFPAVDLDSVAGLIRALES